MANWKRLLEATTTIDFRHDSPGGIESLCFMYHLSQIKSHQVTSLESSQDVLLFRCTMIIYYTNVDVL